MLNGKSSTFENYFNLLYTMYSVPNIFLPLVVVGMVDKYGAWQSLIVITSFMVLGEFVTSPSMANGVDLSFAIWVGF